MVVETMFVNIFKTLVRVIQFCDDKMLEYCCSGVDGDALHMLVLCPVYGISPVFCS